MKDCRKETQLSLADAFGPIAMPGRNGVHSEAELVALALALGADQVAGWSPAEQRLTKSAARVSPKLIEETRDAILSGRDPLGEAFCTVRDPADRRPQGATYTPPVIVEAMVDWAAQFATADRIVDPGTGSARYLVYAGKQFPDAVLIGVETDPLAAMLGRANLAVAGLQERAELRLADFRSIALPPIKGATLYVGNPPYVRHHLLEPVWKQWLTDEAQKRGYSASQLAGLHVHFFLATVAKAQPGDFGAFITAAEWLDVNYGSLVRDLFLGELGGRRIVVIEPTAAPFADAATTAAVTYFQIGAKPKSVRLKRISKLPDLRERGGRTVRRERLENERRWSHLTRAGRKGPEGYVELGELCRVHRGQVTGLNKLWIEGPLARELPERVLFPSVTKARELFRAGPVLADATALRRVIDLPVELDEFDANERRAVDRFLAKAKAMGGDSGYVASNRKAWWSVGLRRPAPILATYMARRPPAFVQNEAEARHINIAHGIYPREPLAKRILSRLAEYLSRAVRLSEGRTYAGGLTKFEPREMERLLVPGLELLAKE